MTSSTDRPGQNGVARHQPMKRQYRNEIWNDEWQTNCENSTRLIFKLLLTTRTTRWMDEIGDFMAVFSCKWIFH